MEHQKGKKTSKKKQSRKKALQSMINPADPSITNIAFPNAKKRSKKSGKENLAKAAKQVPGAPVKSDQIQSDIKGLVHPGLEAEKKIIASDRPPGKPVLQPHCPLVQQASPLVMGTAAIVTVRAPGPGDKPPVKFLLKQGSSLLMGTCSKITIKAPGSGNVPPVKPILQPPCPPVQQASPVVKETVATTTTKAPRPSGRPPLKPVLQPLCPSVPLASPVVKGAGAATTTTTKAPGPGKPTQKRINDFFKPIVRGSQPGNPTVTASVGLPRAAPEVVVLEDVK